MVLNGLDESCYTDIWNAPEGNDYAVQFRRKDESLWSYIDFAICYKTASAVMSKSVGNLAFHSEYRIVKLSRYPPCSVCEIIKYHKD